MHRGWEAGALDPDECSAGSIPIEREVNMASYMPTWSLEFARRGFLDVIGYLAGHHICDSCCTVVGKCMACNTLG